MILCGETIKEYVEKGKIVIRPFNEENISVGSYDVRLGREFMFYREEVLDMRNQDYEFEKVKLKSGSKVAIVPKGYGYFDCDVDFIFYGGVLGITEEWIELPNDICAQYQGRSTLGRMFLTSHQTAGWIDAGFKGNVVLEIIAMDRPVILYVGDRIGQLIFFKMDREIEKGYSDLDRSKYKYQKGVVGFRTDKF